MLASGAIRVGEARVEAPSEDAMEKRRVAPAGASKRRLPVPAAATEDVSLNFRGIFARQRKKYFPEVPPEAVTRKSCTPPPAAGTRSPRTRSPT